MKKELYTVEVPAILVDLIGPQNLRENIEKTIKSVFSNWAIPSLVEKIKVTKPREKKNGGEDG
ncbi:hypothetical protein LCGC14_1393420 [marine sediment metagenome]|uniref:Uncharacterized protein n=1 Tax=marine sediment metagenome TaxID=412755 RepID=A0A0F9KK16_9ZZZZ